MSITPVVVIQLTLHLFTCCIMSTPPVRSRNPSYDNVMLNTYITEAKQTSNMKQYCKQHNIVYSTFLNNLSEYNRSNDKENWSPKSKRKYSHRVLTDSTEKQAIDEFARRYDNNAVPRSGKDLETLLLIIHNGKNPDKPILKLSGSTIQRIKQQYGMSKKRAAKRKSTMMSVDDSVLTGFQTQIKHK